MTNQQQLDEIRSRLQAIWDREIARLSEQIDYELERVEAMIGEEAALP